MARRKLLDARLLVLALVMVPLAGCSGDKDETDPVSKPRGLGPMLFDDEVEDDRPKAATTQFDVGVNKIWAFTLANGIDPDTRIDVNWSLNGGWFLTNNFVPRDSMTDEEFGKPDLPVVAFLSLGAIGGFMPGRFGVRFQENGQTLTEAFFTVGDGDGFGKIMFAENYDANGEALGYPPFDAGIQTVYAVFRFVGFEPTDVLHATWTLDGADPFSNEYEMQDLSPSGETDIGWTALTLSNPDGLGPGTYGLTLEAADEMMSGSFAIV